MTLVLTFAAGDFQERLLQVELQVAPLKFCQSTQFQRIVGSHNPTVGLAEDSILGRTVLNRCDDIMIL